MNGFFEFKGDNLVHGIALAKQMEKLPNCASS